MGCGLEVGKMVKKLLAKMVRKVETVGVMLMTYSSVFNAGLD